MAMKFNSENVEVPVNLDAGTISIDLYEDRFIPGDGGVDELHLTHLVSLEMSEDQAVELATLLLLGATKMRGQRLEREVIEDVPAPVQRILRPCYCDSAYHPQGC